MAWEWVVFGFLVAMILINLGLTIQPFWKSIKEISEQYESSITPPTFYFPVAWTVLYVYLLVMSIYSLNESAPYMERIGIWFIFSCIFNVAWLIAFQVEALYLSVAIISLLWSSLLMVYLRLDVSYLGSTFEGYTKIWVYNVPISLYLGWISFAFVVNLFTLKTHATDMEEDNLIALFMFFLILLNGFIIYLTRDFPFTTVILLALLGVAYKQSEHKKIFNATLFNLTILFIYSLVMLIVALVK